LARERAGLLEDAAGLADDDLLLALALEPDQRVDEPLALLVLAEVRDLDGQAVRHFLVNERHELFANRLRNPKAEVAVRDHALRELLRPDGQAREDLLDEALEVFSAARGDRDELREPLGRELRQRRQQLDAAREVVDLVQHEERSVELAVEHLDQRMVLARELAGIDDEQRQIAIFERLMDLPRHEPMQRALRAPRVSRRVDEDGLIGPTIQHAEHPLTRRVRLVGDDAELFADEYVQQRRLAHVRPADDRYKATTAVARVVAAHRSAPRASLRQLPAPLCVGSVLDRSFEHSYLEPRTRRR